MSNQDKAERWAISNNFSIFASRETIVMAYDAHLRLLAKHAARKIDQKSAS